MWRNSQPPIAIRQALILSHWLWNGFGGLHRLRGRVLHDSGLRPAGRARVADALHGRHLAQDVPGARDWAGVVADLWGAQGRDTDHVGKRHHAHAGRNHSAVKTQTRMKSGAPVVAEISPE